MNNNAYLDPSWFNGEVILDDTTLLQYIQDLNDHQLNVHYCDSGVIQEDGHVPGQCYCQLLRWSRQARSYNPAVKIMAVLNYGNRTGSNTNFGSAAFNKGLNKSIDNIIHQCGVDGVHLDIEGFMDNDNTLLNTLAYLKSHALKDKTLSISTPATRWSSTFISNVAYVVDQINPMIYDCMGWGSWVKDSASYTSYFENVILTYSSAMEGFNCELVPTLPAYETKTASDGTVYHDATVESVTNAITALNNAIDKGANVHGAGIFWWPDYNGLHAVIYTQYQQDQNAWKGQWLKL